MSGDEDKTPVGGSVHWFYSNQRTSRLTVSLFTAGAITHPKTAYETTHARCIARQTTSTRAGWGRVTQILHDPPTVRLGRSPLVQLLFHATPIHDR